MRWICRYYVSIPSFTKRRCCTDEEVRECDLRPHKIAICSKLDDLTQEGREIGACNTVILKKNEKGERILVGHNTEYVSDLFALSLSLSKIRKR